jgi:Fic family protein
VFVGVFVDFQKITCYFGCFWLYSNMDYTIILPDHIPSDMVLSISEVDMFKGQWSALKNLAPDRLSQLKKVATIASIGSSTRIEGVKLSDSEIEKLISNIHRHSFQSRDEEEVAGYADTMNMIFDSFANINITENHIKQLHRILLRYSTKDTRHAGEYKKLSNNVEAFDDTGKSLGMVFETATPFLTPFYMTSLIEWYDEQIKDNFHHSLLVIGTFIVHFLAIHPFQDGNGRLSRILTTLMLLRHGYHYVPYCSLESIVEENKDRYYLSLRKAQGSFKTDQGELIEWLRFFLLLLKKQKNILTEKISKESILSLANLPTESIRIMELIKDRGRLTISNIVSLTGANRNAVKTRLKHLVEERYIERHGVGKGSWYSMFGGEGVGKSPPPNTTY